VPTLTKHTFVLTRVLIFTLQLGPCACCLPTFSMLDVKYFFKGRFPKHNDTKNFIFWPIIRRDFWYGSWMISRVSANGIHMFVFISCVALHLSLRKTILSWALGIKLTRTCHRLPPLRAHERRNAHTRRRKEARTRMRMYVALSFGYYAVPSDYLF
jgi:hypothetical protein